MKGQQVEILVDERQPAGEHSVIWHAGRRASGIYFYRLVADEITETKKLVIQR